LPTSAAYELVQASQALQAVQALHHLDAMSASVSASDIVDIEPLTQDPTLLTAMDPAQLAAAMQNCQLPPLEANCQAILNGYKEGLTAGHDLARTIQV
jgi:hypothetical protein